jgi:hypothetical protein
MQGNRAADWAAVGAAPIPRQCPGCLSDSVIGHGRRRKQAHDENHDWIGIRRGLCNRCQKTITFLPAFSLAYTHYSLIARSQALLHYFVEGCSLDLAAPLVKDPNRVPVASTLRRWFRGLDSADRWDRLSISVEPSVPTAEQLHVLHPFGALVSFSPEDAGHGARLACRGRDPPLRPVRVVLANVRPLPAGPAAAASLTNELDLRHPPSLPGEFLPLRLL